MANVKIKIKMPGKDEPGYLKRMREALRFSEMMREASDKPSPAIIDQMVEFLAQFVEEPKGRDKAKEALWEISETQFLEIFEAITKTDVAMGEANGGPSATGT